MNPGPSSMGESWRRLEPVFDRFEEEWHAAGSACINDHLPPPDAPERRRVLCELIRIEIDLRWAKGNTAHVEDYLRRFPELLSDPDLTPALLHHEIHIRRAHGRAPTAEELRARFPDMVAELPEAAAPRTLGRYELRERLGQGGFATVFCGWDPELARAVAIKLPRADLLADPSWRERLAREGRSAARLRHPAIVPLYEVGQEGARLWLVYEYVAGPTLAELCRTTQPAARQAAEWMATVADALDYAHQCGIVHRDLKPANILLRGGTEPVLTDFGLALNRESHATLTQHGEILGTPAYMSPEQAGGDAHTVDGRSDIYSLGVMLYELLGGRLPFAGSALVLLHRTIHDEPTPLRTLNKDIPIDLETICAKALAKEPGQRYATAGAFAADLRRYLNHQPIHARRIGMVGQLTRWRRRNPALAATLTLTTLVLVLLGGFSYWRVARERDRVEELAANLAVDRGLHLCEQDDLGPGLLWLVRGLELDARAGSREASIRRLNLAAWSARWPECQRVIVHDPTMIALAVNCADSTLLTSAADGRMRRWNWDGDFLDVPLAAQKPLRYPTCAADGTLFALDWEGRIRATNPRHEPDNAVPAHRFAHHPKQAELLIATTTSIVRIHPETRVRIGPEWRHDVSRITDVTYSHDGSLVLSAGDDRRARIWDTRTGTVVATLEHPRVVEYVAGGTDHIATAAADNRVRLWDLRTFKLLHTLEHSGVLTGLAFSPDGRWLLTGHSDQFARLWDVRRGALACPPLAHTDAIVGVVFANEGTRFATASKDGLVRIWGLPSAPMLGEPIPHEWPIWSAAYALDGSFVAIGTGDKDRHVGAVHLWDATRSRVRPDFAHPAAVIALAVSPDGRTLLSGTQRGQLQAWDVGTGRVQGEPLQRRHFITTVGFRPEGRYFAAAGEGDLVFLNHENRATSQLVKHQDTIRSADLRARRVLTGGYDRTARLWNLDTGEPLGPPMMHVGEVGAVALRHDGLRAVVGTDHNVADLWDVSGRKAVHLGRLPHKGTVRAVAFHPDGELVLTGSWDRTARLWDVATRRPIGPAFPHDAEVETAIFHPDGRSCLTGGFDHQARFWPVPRAMEGSRDALRLWAEVLSGYELTPDDTLRHLDRAAWLARLRTFDSTRVRSER